MLDQMQVSSREDDECQRVIADLNNCVVEAWREDNYIALGPHATVSLPLLFQVSM
jgi:hypothetical protein